MPPSEVGAVYVAIKASTAGFASQAREEINAAMRPIDSSSALHPEITPRVNAGAAEAQLKRSLGGAVKSALAYVGGIFAAEKVFEFGKSVIEEAATVQKAQESIRHEFGSSAEEIERFATRGATALGISTAASETASGRFGILFQNLGVGEKRATEMTVGFQKVVGALSQIKDVDPNQALQALNTTLATGSTRGLRSMGVALDSTAIKAEALREGLVKSNVDTGKLAAAQFNYEQAQKAVTAATDKFGASSTEARAAVIKQTLAHEALAAQTKGVSGTLTIAEKDQAIYGLVTKNLGDYMEQARKHSGDYANQQKVLTAEWANAKAAIGEGLLPYATQFLHVLLDSVKFIREYQSEFVTLAAGIGVAAGAFVLLKAGAFAYSLVSDIVALSTALLTGNMAALDVALEANPFGAIAVAVAVVAVGMYELYQHSALVRGALDAVAHVAREAFGATFHWIGHTVIPDVRGAITGFVNLTGRIWDRWGNEIKAVVRPVFNFVRTIIRDDLQIVRDVIHLVLDVIHGNWSRVWKDIGHLLGDVLGTMLDALFGAVGLFLRAAVGIGSAVLHGIINEARHAPGQLLNLIKRIPRLITGAVPDILGAAKDLGIKIVKGIISGVGSLGGALKDSLEQHVKSALGSLNPFSPVEEGAARYISQPITRGTVDGLRPFHDTMKGAIIPPMRSVLSDAQTQGTQWGRQTGTGIQQGVNVGVRPLGRTLANTLNNAMDSALAAAQSHLGIHSPSMLFAQQLGQPIMQGILHGLGGLEHALAQKIIRSATAATSIAGGTVGGTAATGANQRLGYQMMLAAGWPASEWGALQALWTRESGWNQFARNPSSGAFGIPQELGHAVSAAYLAGDVQAQIAWGLDYIRGRYGSPSAAWAHEQSIGWYQGGGVVPGYAGQAQPAVVHGGEVVFTPEQMAALRSGVTIAGDLVIIEPQDGRAAGMKALDIIARRIR